MMRARIAAVLNRGLADSTRARRQAAALEGRSLRIRLDHSSRSAVVSIRAGALDLADAADHPADATITGGALALLSLATADRAATDSSVAVLIDGDQQIAAQFVLLAQWLKPDVEHELARLLGLGPARLLAEGARRAGAWFSRFTSTGARHSADYLAHERRWLVPRAELAHQQRATDEVAAAVQRLGERVTALDRDRGGGR